MSLDNGPKNGRLKSDNKICIKNATFDNLNFSQEKTQSEFYA